MTMVTPEEIAEFRTQVGENPDALKALKAIEDCEGDLEDAAMVLAIRVGQQPEIANSEWLDGLAKKCRTVICQDEYRNDLVNGNLDEVIRNLTTAKLCPAILVIPVLMYVLQKGVNKFCQPLDSII